MEILSIGLPLVYQEELSDPDDFRFEELREYKDRVVYTA